MSLEQALKNGINIYTYRWRIKQGWGKEQASTQPARPYNQHQPYINQAKQNGINFQTYYERLKLGWSREKASTEPIRSVSKVDPTLKQKANENGITTQVLRRRLFEG